MITVIFHMIIFFTISTIFFILICFLLSILNFEDNPIKIFKEYFEIKFFQFKKFLNKIVINQLEDLTTYGSKYIGKTITQKMTMIIHEKHPADYRFFITKNKDKLIDIELRLKAKYIKNIKKIISESCNWQPDKR